uniref:Plant heme peroxidase family profile domain-containing protein n=1 Tax=Physcomitrium patens TaxID=3218 RepID=A0A2K1JD99_PHYPA|nr:hypothetical protein PHYPA_019784 [Physcomitrium patens]
MVFDNYYYINLMTNQGLLHIDFEIAWNSQVKPFIVVYAKDNPLCHKNFAMAFTKLSEHDPLISTQGEVQKYGKAKKGCSKIYTFRDMDRR